MSTLSRRSSLVTDPDGNPMFGSSTGALATALAALPGADLSLGGPPMDRSLHTVTEETPGGGGVGGGGGGGVGGGGAGYGADALHGVSAIEPIPRDVIFPARAPSPHLPMDGSGVGGPVDGDARFPADFDDERDALVLETAFATLERHGLATPGKASQQGSLSFERADAGGGVEAGSQSGSSDADLEGYGGVASAGEDAEGGQRKRRSGQGRRKRRRGGGWRQGDAVTGIKKTDRSVDVVLPPPSAASFSIEPTSFRGFDPTNDMDVALMRAVRFVGMCPFVWACVLRSS